MGRRVLHHPVCFTVDGDQMIFDYTGASPQTNHFFNSKPYIIAAEMIAQPGLAPGP